MIQRFFEPKWIGFVDFSTEKKRDSPRPVLLHLVVAWCLVLCTIHIELVGRSLDYAVLLLHAAVTVEKLKDGNILSLLWLDL